MIKLIFNSLLYFFVREGAPLVVSQYETLYLLPHLERFFKTFQYFNISAPKNRVTDVSTFQPVQSFSRKYKIINIY